MLVGLCDVCEYGHPNYDKLLSLMNEIEQKVCVSLKEEQKVLKHEQFFKTSSAKLLRNTLFALNFVSPMPLDPAESLIPAVVVMLLHWLK